MNGEAAARLVRMKPITYATAQFLAKVCIVQVKRLMARLLFGGFHESLRSPPTRPNIAILASKQLIRRYLLLVIKQTRFEAVVVELRDVLEMNDTPTTTVPTTAATTDAPVEIKLAQDSGTHPCFYKRVGRSSI